MHAMLTVAIVLKPFAETVLFSLYINASAVVAVLQ